MVNTMHNDAAKLSLAQIRETLTDTVIMTAAAFVVIAMISSLMRIPVTGFLPVMGVHIALASLVLSLFLLRRHLSTLLKARLIALLFFIAGIAGIHTFGISGNGIYFLFASSLFSSFIINIRVAIGIGVVGGLIIVLHLLLITLFKFEFSVQQSPYNMSTATWITTLVVYSYCLSIALFLIHHFFEYLKSLLNRQHLTIQSQSSHIEQSEAILHKIINHLPYGILWKDTNLRYLGANQTFLAENNITDVEHIIGKTDHDLVSKELANKFDALDQKILSGKEMNVRYEEQMPNQQGQMIYSEVSRLPLHTKHGELIGVLTSYHDVSAYKNLEIQVKQALEEAERASQTKSQFLANMSHEIRTPINGVLGLLELCLQTELSEKQRAYLSRADFSARLLLHIINDVLDLSKIEAGHMQLESVPFHFDNLLVQMQEMFYEQAQSKQISFNTHFAGQPHIAVSGDPTRITQIMMNLCSNAIKFTEHGEVNLTVRLVANQEKSKVVIQVSDTGIGIPSEAIPQLFQNFTQADAAINRKFGGTGLGLSIVKQLVDLISGSVKVTSEVGKGTEFLVMLELPRSKIEITEEPALDIHIDLTDRHILLVEDNMINQEIASTILQHKGASVTLAADGQQAIDFLNISQFDVVLMDVQMPVMDGCTAVEIIRKDPRWETLPIIALTANVMANEIAHYRKIGFSEHLGKPFDSESLLQMVQRFITSA